MPGTTYVVEIVLDTKGDLPGAISKAGSAIDRVEGKTRSLSASLGGLGEKLLSGFTGAVETVGSSLMTLGKIGVGAAITGATYGVMGLNKELETTKVSLAAVLNANNLTDGIEAGMERAAAWVQQMKIDARELPGEFADLLYIVQSGAQTAFKAGLDDVQFERIASQAMAAGKAMSVNLKQTGRELALLFEGRAGAHNVFGSRLGIRADGFNDKAAAERVKIIQDALEKFQPAIKAFGTTMDAQSSTLLDNAKTFLGASTSGLFGRLKDTFAEINAWFDANRSTIDTWSTRISDTIVRGFDEGKRIILEYWPAFKTFVGNAYDKFVSIWKDALPYIKSIGESIKEFLSDSGSIDRIADVLKLYIAAKSIGAVGGLLGAGGAGLVPGAGALGAGLNLGMAAGVAGYGVGTMIGGDAGGRFGGGIAGGAALGASVGGPWGALAGGLLGAGAGAYSHFTDKELKQQRAMEDYANKLLSQTDAVEALSGKNDIYSHTLGLVNESSEVFAVKLQEMTDLFGEAGAALFKDKASFANEAYRRANGVSLTDTPMDLPSAKFIGAQDISKSLFDLADVGKRSLEKEREKQKKAAAGSGNINVAKVEITVSSNQAPGQIARDVAKEMTDMRRYRRSSPSAMNVSAGR